MDSQKQPLLGMTLAELKQVVASLGMPSFTAKQIASWMYDKQVAEIDEMTNLSVKNRQRRTVSFWLNATASETARP